MNIRSIVGSEKAITFGQRDLLVNDIRRKGRCMFIICVAAEIPMEYLRIFLSHGATDADIPFPHDEFKEQTQDVRDKAKVFNKFQYLFPQILKGGDFSADYPSAGVPIKFSESRLGSGVGGDVYKARLDTDYCKISAVKTDPVQAGLTREIAIKVLKTETKAQKEHATREVSFAHILSAYRPHAHITTSYASLSVHTEDAIEKTSYIISELAERSLDVLMRNIEPKPAMKLETEEWMRKQIRGLASALALIHESQNGLTGIHHDIKPDNILLFHDGTLKFTDWGCASFKPSKPSEPSDPTAPTIPQTTIRGQFPYLPPESLEGSATGRPHDVWALACVFTEMLVWLTEGVGSHGTFAKTVYETKGEYDCWFIGKGDSIGLSKVLTDKLDHLGEIEEGKWLNLVSIIRKMFEIGPQNRITSQDLVKAFNDPQNEI